MNQNFGGLLCALLLVAAVNAQDTQKREDMKAPVRDEAWMNLRMGKGSDMLYTSQQLRPEGQLIDFGGRFCSIALARGGKFVLVKTSSQLVSVDADAFKGVQQTEFPGKQGGSMHGLAVTADGTKAYVTGGKDKLFCAVVAEDGKFHLTNEVSLAENGKAVNPLGVALLPGEERALIARSLPNDVVLVHLASGKIEARIPAGTCPYSIAVSKDGATAFVSNYGGRRPVKGDKTEKSAGSEVVVDARAIPASGTVSVLDLTGTPREIAQITVGLHPSEVLMNADRSRLYVANVGGDSVSVIDTATRKVIETLNTKADPLLPWGSLSDGLALSADERTLFVANAGINAIACIDLAKPSTTPRLIPSGWFPGALCVRGTELFVSNVRNGLQKIPAARDEAEVAARDERARANSHLAFALRSAARSSSAVPPVPVPANLGEPSVIKHVVYVIKENRTYDQMLGDLGRGNGDPKHCEFDKTVIPNHKALATVFPLLDNYYCNGVNSADGHMWAMQGITTPYREKDRPGYRCAYDFGTDELCFAACGFMWDLALMSGLSFRNYGELDYTVKLAGKTYNDFYTDWKEKTGKTAFKTAYYIEALRNYSSPIYPGWEMAIPDQVRADAFLKELADFERRGDFPNFVLVYLPNDHSASELTVQSYLADNDLALGRVVEGISKSKFWKDTAIFVIEDDPQTGHDHVDGHRSLCFVASPWSKRGAIVSKFYNESSVLHTIGQILGLPPLNQMVAAAPLMTDCFTATPDATPYTCLVPEYQLNQPKKKVADWPKTRSDRKLAARIAALNFDKPDNRLDDDAFNRSIWMQTRPGERYPAEFSGAHGKGLKALGLTLADLAGDGDDD